MGQEKRQAGQFKEAESFLNLAIEKDPHFASAKGALGLILIQFLNQKEKGQEMLKQALEDAEGLPQQEYLPLLGGKTCKCPGHSLRPPSLIIPGCTIFAGHIYGFSVLPLQREETTPETTPGTIPVHREKNRVKPGPEA